MNKVAFSFIVTIIFATSYPIDCMEEENFKSPLYTKLIYNKKRENQFNKVAWSPNGTKVASWIKEKEGEDNKIFVWDIAKSKPNKPIQCPKPLAKIHDFIFELFWTRDNGHLIIATNCDLIMFNTKTKWSHLFYGAQDGEEITAVTFVPRSETIICAVKNQSIQKSSIIAHQIVRSNGSGHIRYKKFEILPSKIFHDCYISHLSYNPYTENYFILLSDGRKDTRHTSCIENLQPQESSDRTIKAKANFSSPTDFYIESTDDSKLILHIPTKGKETVLQALGSDFSGSYVFTISSAENKIAYIYTTRQVFRRFNWVYDGIYPRPTVSVHSAIKIYDFKKQKIINEIKFPYSDLEIYDLKYSPYGGLIAISTNKGIYVYKTQAYSLQELQYREMGILSRECKRIEKFRKKHTK